MLWRYICSRIFLAFILLLVTLLDYCEMSIYPGLRRKPLQQLQTAYDVNSDFLSQLMEENARRRLQQQFEQQLELINMQINRQRQRQERLREERYRHQQLAALADAAANYHHRFSATSHDNSEELQRVNDGNEYIGKMYYNERQPLDFEQPEIRQRPEYVYPRVISPKNIEENNDKMVDSDRIEFAVAPSDPRFYETIETNQLNKDEEITNFEDNDDTLEEKRVQEVGEKEYAQNDEDGDDDLDARVLDEYEEYIPTIKTDNDHLTRTKPSDHLTLQPLSSGNTNEQIAGVNYHRIKPPVTIPKIGLSTDLGKFSNINKNISEINSSQHKGFTALMDQLHSNVHHQDQLNDKTHQQMVAREQLAIKDEMDMYLVALIAGVSAAVTVGLLVLGIIWYTFHRRAKAAADVEYPAYGVTGPNKNITTSVDRKLAQSAQMYHYQHQKQQIMALENRTNNEDGYEMTYIDSDDDNEEGDYTVYECPGLAPTGEMEVKNPLFLDDTPVTPSLGSQPIAQVAAQQPPSKENIFQKPQKGITNNNSKNSKINPEKRPARKPKK